MKDKRKALAELINVLDANNIVADQFHVSGFEFMRTCSACPEQYDVFDKDGNQVGYVRLRYGNLKCEYPDCGGVMVYHENFEDGLKGCFDDNDERMEYLHEIVNAICIHTSKSDNLPFKRVFCFDNFDNDVFGSWCAGFYYDVVSYDKETEEWYIKDHSGDVGVVDKEDFDEYFERIDE